MQKIILLAALLSFGLLSRCGKEDNKSPNILTAKTWKRGIKDQNPSTNPPGDVRYSPVKDCEDDDLFTFNTKGQLIIKRGDHKCNPDEATKAILQYTINRKEQTLTINGIHYTLAEESKNQIKFYTPIPTGSGVEYLIYLLQ